MYGADKNKGRVILDRDDGRCQAVAYFGDAFHHGVVANGEHMSKPQATVTIIMSLAAANAVRNALETWVEVAQDSIAPEAGDVNQLKRDVALVRQVLGELS